MSSLILKSAAQVLFPIMLTFSLFLLIRGHDEPGGGLPPDSVGAAAFALYAVAYDVAAARRALRLEPRRIVALGLLVALGSGLPAVVRGVPYLTGIWVSIDLPGPRLLPFGTPLLFDTGVYLAVLGTTTAVIFSLGED